MTFTTQQTETLDRLNSKRKYYERNKDKCKEMTLSWKQRNKEYIKEYNKAYMRLYRAKRKEEKSKKSICPRSHLVLNDPIFNSYVNSIDELL